MTYPNHTGDRRYQNPSYTSNYSSSNLNVNSHLIESIKFGTNKPADIFSDIAEQAAKIIKKDEKDDNKLNKENNKTTQLRKFYDELAMWNDRVQSTYQLKEDEYKKLEPFIKMLKAKVAYAQGRKHINKNFSSIFNRCIDQINSSETLREAKLFMEAVMGYCKLYENQR